MPFSAWFAIALSLRPFTPNLSIWLAGYWTDGLFDWRWVYVKPSRRQTPGGWNNAGVISPWPGSCV